MASVFDPILSGHNQHLAAVIRASRPAGWCFGPILFGIGLIHSGSLPRNFWSLSVAAAQVISLSFPLCTIFGMNDVYDYHSDIRSPRKIASGLEGGVLSPAYHASVRLAAQISSIIIFSISLITLRPQNIVATSFLILLGWQYSAAPLRLKEIPVVDSLSNGTIVFCAWLVGYTFCRGSILTAPNKAYALALCTSAMHALGAAVDVDSDMIAGQRTIATFLGPRLAVSLGAVAFVICLLTEPWTSVFGIYLWGGFVSMLASFLYIQWAHQAFRCAVFWTVGMSVCWFASKASSFHK